MKNLTIRWMLAAVALFSLASPALAGLPGLPREKNALYLEDFLDQPYRVKVLADSAIFYNSDLARFLGTMRAGQIVELQAIGDGRLRVRGLAKQGQVAGWMEAPNLSPIDPKFVESLRRSAKRRERVNGLIARNEVALGMTPVEVATSLGQPVGKTSRIDANGSTETWDYVRYIQTPRRVVGYDRYGRATAGVVYERVPAGTFSVVFTGEVVSAVEQSEGTAATAQAGSIPAPITFNF